MALIDTAQALHRFGLGPRPGDAARIREPARELLEADLDGRGDPAFDIGTLKSTNAALIAFVDYRKRKREARQAAVGKPETMERMGGREATPERNIVRVVYEEELAARGVRAMTLHVGFVERLVAFWTNHFAVSAKQSGITRLLAGAFEREAIRPHVLGRFEDMLLAVTKHPAMLTYLDNARSVGPNSPAGHSERRGLNENHAREIMELHTLGVDGGYSQADVTAFARVLTGWTFERRPVAEPAQLGRFMFQPRWHEPGPQAILGKSYAQTDIAQGEAVLHDLANHPATARHIAAKLARAFVSDAPPDLLIARLEANFRHTGGNLKELARTLVRSEEAWSGPPEKIKSPQEFLVSAVRGINADVPFRLAFRALVELGHEPWSPGSPAGYPVDNASWLAPDALTNRLDLAERLAELSQPDLDPRQLVTELLGPSAASATSEAVARAASRQQGLALLLMSPDFQRR